jgi:hypothetical protein
VTDEQRSRWPIFIATRRAVDSWPFFRVARSLRIHSDMLVARALKNSQLADGEPMLVMRPELKSNRRDRGARDTIAPPPQLADESVNAFCLPRLRLDR